MYIGEKQTTKRRLVVTAILDGPGRLVGCWGNIETVLELIIAILIRLRQLVRGRGGGGGALHIFTARLTSHKRSSIKMIKSKLENRTA